MMKMLAALSLELLVSNKPPNFEYRSEHICWSVSGLLCTDHLKTIKRGYRGSIARAGFALQQPTQIRSPESYTVPKSG